jgi:hypothetical protein
LFIASILNYPHYIAGDISGFSGVILCFLLIAKMIKLRGNRVPARSSYSMVYHLLSYILRYISGFFNPERQTGNRKDDIFQKDVIFNPASIAETKR